MVNPSARGADAPSVRRATASDLPAIVAMLVRAFDDDPVATYMFPGSRRRQLGLHSFFTSQLRRQYLPRGNVYVTEDLNGAALWAPPGKERTLGSEALQLSQLLPTVPFLASSHTIGALRLLLKIEGLHPTERHWYLFTLGTGPKHQGKGIGSALLRTVLEQVDEEGEPAFLESSKESNISLYARFGFKVINEVGPKWGSPPVWRMWREPRIPQI